MDLVQIIAKDTLTKRSFLFFFFFLGNDDSIIHLWSVQIEGKGGGVEQSRVDLVQNQLIFNLHYYSTLLSSTPPPSPLYLNGSLHISLYLYTHLFHLLRQQKKKKQYFIRLQDFDKTKKYLGREYKSSLSTFSLLIQHVKKCHHVVTAQSSTL